MFPSQFQSLNILFTNFFIYNNFKIFLSRIPHFLTKVHATKNAKDPEPKNEKEREKFDDVKEFFVKNLWTRGRNEAIFPRREAPMQLQRNRKRYRRQPEIRGRMGDAFQPLRRWEISSLTLAARSEVEKQIFVENLAEDVTMVWNFSLCTCENFSCFIGCTKILFKTQFYI